MAKLRLDARAVLACGLIAVATAAGAAWQSPPQRVDPLAARVDPYTARQRVVVMTDIANEPDDQMSMVRFLVYSNQFEVEGLIASTSTWMKNKVRPDVLRTLVDAYAQVQPNLLQAPAWLSVRRCAARGGRRGAAFLRHGGSRTRTRCRRART